MATGFYVAGEFALVAADRAKIERKAEAGDRRARSAMVALRTLGFQLSGAQLGITITSLIVGFIAEPTIAKAIEPLLEPLGLPGGTTHGVAITLGLIIATAVSMVVGELIPKNLALAKPADLALVVATPLRLFNAALKPLIVLLNSAANATVRLFGIEPRDELSSVRSLEELEILIRSSRREGVLEEEDFSLLSRSIGFGGKSAADALVPRTAIVALTRGDTVADMARVSLDSGHSRFPVIGADIDDIVGVAHVKDSYRVPHEERSSTPITEITQDTLVAPESRKLESLLLEMRRDRKQLAVIIDEYGGTAGIITLEDLLEEIVGDIEDEYDDATVPRITGSPAGIEVVSGLLHPDELEDATGFVMPEGDYETLAGFLLTLFDRIPEQGDHTGYGGWEFKVVEMNGKRIARVLIAAPPGMYFEPSRPQGAE